jgi:hypothetical protein
MRPVRWCWSLPSPKGQERPTHAPGTTRKIPLTLKLWLIDVPASARDLPEPAFNNSQRTSRSSPDCTPVDQYSTLNLGLSPANALRHRSGGGLGPRFLTIVCVSNRLAQSGVQPLGVQHHLPIVHTLHSAQWHLEISGVGVPAVMDTVAEFFKAPFRPPMRQTERSAFWPAGGHRATLPGAQ